MPAVELEIAPTRTAIERLSDFTCVATDDVDEAAEQIGQIFCPHALNPVRGRAAGFSARHNCASYNGFSINYVAYGGTVSIDPGYLDRFFLVQVPISGGARIRAGLHEFNAAPGRMASLLSPTIPTQMTWSDCSKAIILLERRMVEQRAAALSGKTTRAVEFNPVIDLTLTSGQTLRNSLEELLLLVEHLGPSGRLSRLSIANWRELLLNHFLNSQHHTQSEAIAKFAGRAERLPRALRTAREFLADNADEPLDLAELACVSGIGIRALQLGFRRHFGLTISQMLLDLRLGGLNVRLAQAESGASITDIAFELGFTHLGRMAGAYREKFGESPSATLRRRIK